MLQSSEFDAPPSSQPRGDSEDGEEAGENVEHTEREAVNEGEVELTADARASEDPSDDEKSADEDEAASDGEYSVAEGLPVPEVDSDAESSPAEDDLLDGFDVDSEEKEFLKELLPHASQEEHGLLQKAKEGDDYTGSRRLSTFQSEAEFLTYLKSTVQDFAKEHPFWSLDRWADDDIAEFETDIHEFATAAGMDEKQAEAEFESAFELWKHARGLVDTEMEVEVEAPPPSSSKKRKREEKSVPTGNPAEDDAKRRRKEEKKARKKEAKLLKMSVVATQPIDASQKLKLQSSQDWYGASAVHDTIPLPLPPVAAESNPIETKTSTVTKIAVPPKTQAPVLPSEPAAQVSKVTPSTKRQRKKARQGPTTSTYFPGAEELVQNVSNEMVVDNAIGLPSDLLAKVEAAKAAVANAIQTTENQHKRKRKRNKNKLPEETVVAPVVVEQEPVVPPIAATAVEAKTPKKNRRRQRKANQNAASEAIKTASEAKLTKPADEVALPNVSEPSEAKPKGTRRERRRKSKILPEGSIVQTSNSGEIAAKAAETSIATEASSSDPSSKKRRRDQEKAAEGQSEVPPVTKPETEERRPKRARPARKTKAEWEQERAEAAKSEVTNPAPLPAEVTPKIVEPKQAKPVKLSPMERVALEVEATAKPVEQEAGKHSAEHPNARRNDKKKGAEIQGDVTLANTDAPLVELEDTNSKKQRSRKSRQRKSISEMDGNPQSEEAKARHL